MPRKRPIMTSDHADKMEITVVFQCPPLGKVGMGLLGMAGMGLWDKVSAVGLVRDLCVFSALIIAIIVCIAAF